MGGGIEMIKKGQLLLLVLSLIVGMSLPAGAALSDRGGGLIYDDALHITWLQNAGLALTENFGLSLRPDGRMTWITAQAYIQAMNDANYLGYHDWRLPATTEGPYVWSVSGTTAYGYNITTSEMGYMFYTTLGNKGLYDTNHQTLPGWGLANAGPFKNLQQLYYWSGTESSADTSSAWDFTFNQGFQARYPKTNLNAVWAVRDGDSTATPVPIPAAVLLFGSGLAGLAGCRKRFLTKKLR
jgi:hypothetical protein